MVPTRHNQLTRQEALKNAIKDIYGIEYNDLKLPNSIAYTSDSFLLYETNYEKSRLSPLKKGVYTENPNRLLWSACGSGNLYLVKRAVTYNHLLVGSIIDVKLSTKTRDEMSTLNHPLRQIATARVNGSANTKMGNFLP